MVSKESAEVLLDTLKILEKSDIIQFISFSGVSLYLLKTDVILTASFPDYLQSLLPRESKDYIAQAYSHSPITPPSNVSDVDLPQRGPIEKVKKEFKLDREKKLNRDFDENSEASIETIKALQQDLLQKLDSPDPKKKKKKKK